MPLSRLCATSPEMGKSSELRHVDVRAEREFSLAEKPLQDGTNLLKVLDVQGPGLTRATCPATSLYGIACLNEHRTQACQTARARLLPCRGRGRPGPAWRPACAGTCLFLRANVSIYRCIRPKPSSRSDLLFASRKNFHQCQRSSRFSARPASAKRTKTKTIMSSSNAKVSDAL
jgi:hypothetical protein